MKYSNTFCTLFPIKSSYYFSFKGKYSSEYLCKQPISMKDPFNIHIRLTVDMDINRLIHGLFHIALVISTRPWYLAQGMISVDGWWQGQYEKGHVLIYLSHILPGQITCYCPRKMLLPLRQITRRKLCFYYTCKFGVISIKYVII